MSNKIFTFTKRTHLNMCTSVFINCACLVEINRLVHILSKASVAKKVTLSPSTHNYLTGNPQPESISVQTVTTQAVNKLFNTLSTGTTTIFNLITKEYLEQINSSLTINFKNIYN